MVIRAAHSMQVSCTNLRRSPSVSNVPAPWLVIHPFALWASSRESSTSRPSRVRKIILALGSSDMTMSAPCDAFTSLTTTSGQLTVTTTNMTGGIITLGQAASMLNLGGDVTGASDINNTPALIQGNGKLTPRW